MLAAEQPLSIQVHPSKSAAVQGFAQENAAGIPLDAPHRNYKDANHKPELVYALTPFQAINGFRPLAEIAALLQPVIAAHPAIAQFLFAPDKTLLAMLFARLLAMENEEKNHALQVLRQQLEIQQGEPWQTIRDIAQIYPNDNGLFSPLLLNVVELQPGEAMFLHAETPHAYLHGVALEIMANSDNVLRAGLTPKYIDIPELLANLKFDAKPASMLLTPPIQQGEVQYFPVPVDDFAFAIHTLSSQPVPLDQQSAAIIFCLEGHVCLTKETQQLCLQAGGSAFIAASEFPITLSGSGRIARAFNDLSHSES